MKYQQFYGEESYTLTCNIAVSVNTLGYKRGQKNVSTFQQSRYYFKTSVNVMLHHMFLINL